MKEFKCTKCDHIFAGEPEREEYNNPIYGVCYRDVCRCDKCGSVGYTYTRPAGVVPIGPSFRKGRFKEYKLSNDQIT